MTHEQWRNAFLQSPRGSSWRRHLRAFNSWSSVSNRDCFSQKALFSRRISFSVILAIALTIMCLYCVFNVQMFIFSVSFQCKDFLPRNTTNSDDEDMYKMLHGVKVFSHRWNVFVVLLNRKSTITNINYESHPSTSFIFTTKRKTKSVALVFSCRWTASAEQL